jgi:hypothetical protein
VEVMSRRVYTHIPVPYNVDVMLIVRVTPETIGLKMDPRIEKLKEKQEF